MVVNKRPIGPQLTQLFLNQLFLNPLVGESLSRRDLWHRFLSSLDDVQDFSQTHPPN
jgi:hypothetical protein